MNSALIQEDMKKLNVVGFHQKTSHKLWPLILPKDVLIHYQVLRVRFLSITVSLNISMVKWMKERRTSSKIPLGVEYFELLFKNKIKYVKTR